jgi:DNA-binding transcriptional regulator GbsR (MarR family)
MSVTYDEQAQVSDENVLDGAISHHQKIAREDNKKAEQAGAADSDAQKEVEQALLSFCEACGDFIEYWGFKSIHGRVWAYLALLGEGHSQAELAKRLGVSRASVNLAISELASYGLVKPLSDRHHAPYEANLDVWPVITQVLQQREWSLIERARLSLERLIELAPQVEASAALSTEPPAELFKLERVKRLLQMTEWAQSILRLLINARLPQTQDSWLAWFNKAMKLSEKIKGLLP